MQGEIFLLKCLVWKRNTLNLHLLHNNQHPKNQHSSISCFFSLLQNAGIPISASPNRTWQSDKRTHSLKTVSYSHTFSSWTLYQHGGSLTVDIFTMLYFCSCNTAATRIPQFTAVGAWTYLCSKSLHHHHHHQLLEKVEPDMKGKVQATRHKHTGVLQAGTANSSCIHHKLIQGNHPSLSQAEQLYIPLLCHDGNRDLYSLKTTNGTPMKRFVTTRKISITWPLMAHPWRDLSPPERFLSHDH